mgnify:CR=1 FL=1
MKKEYPLLFKFFITEIYKDIGIKEIDTPNLKRNENNFVIIFESGKKNTTPKDELKGWFVSMETYINGAVIAHELDVDNLERTELFLKSKQVN